MSKLNLYEIMFFAVLIFGIIAIPTVAYLTVTRTRTRKKIAERGFASLAGKCPKCGGKVKIFDIIGKGKGELYGPKIGAVRCTLCGHIEVFTPEETNLR